MAITLTPSELRDLASKLNSNAGEVRTLATTINSNVVSKTEGWTGQSKDQYISDFNDIYPTLSTKLPALLEELAKALNTTANEFEDLDRRLAGR